MNPPVAARVRSVGLEERKPRRRPRLVRSECRGESGIALDDVTIIVPTRNESANIARFLASLPDRARLIVVDSSSDDTLRRIASARPDRTTLVAAEVNIPEARQLGAELATTRWLFFTDADVTLSPHYARRLASLPITDEVGGVAGAKDTAGGHEGYHRWFTRGQQLLDLMGVPAATGSNMLVRADVLRSVGGFDTRLTVNEDTEMMFRVKRSGYDVLFEPELRVNSFDHRRLQSGKLHKLVHSLTRCAMLWATPRSRLVRRGDWGYWSRPS
jgi:glycosyltransferase involved in cell wall biosynthesis